MANRNLTATLEDEITALVVDAQRAAEHSSERSRRLLRQLEFDLWALIAALGMTRRRNPRAAVRDLMVDARRFFADTERQILEQAQADAAEIAVTVADGAWVAASKALGEEVDADVAEDQEQILHGLELEPSDKRSVWIAGLILLGFSLKAWLDKWRRDAVFELERAARLGLAAGDDEAALLARLLGTPTGARVVRTSLAGARRAQDLTGGALGQARRQLEVLTHTHTQASVSEAMARVWTSQPELFSGVQAIVTLDNRTSPICRPRVGFAWLLDGSPFPETPTDIRFPGTPPWHWWCRTFLIGVVRGERPTPGQTYDSWLRKQAEEEQREALGLTKWKLWKDGEVTLAQMLDQRGNPLTVEDLKNRVLKKQVT